MRRLRPVDLYSQAQRLPYTLAGRHGLWSRTGLLGRGVAPRRLRSQARQGVLHRALRGRYLVGRAEPDLLDHARAALSVCPPGSQLGYETAAALYGFGVFGEREGTTIHVVVPQGSRFPQRANLRVHQVAEPTEPRIVLGLPCVSAAQCAVDLARVLPRMDALPVLDAALSAGVVTPDSLAAELGLHSGRRGIAAARLLLPLADGRAECRQESQLRLLLLDGGIPGFTPQLVVVSPTTGQQRRVDLGNGDSQVALEYDGSSHLDRERLRADRERHNWFAELGWRMRYFTDRDLYRRPAYILATVRTTLAQRSRDLGRE